MLQMDFTIKLKSRHLDGDRYFVNYKYSSLFLLAFHCFFFLLLIQFKN